MNVSIPPRSMRIVAPLIVFASLILSGCSAPATPADSSDTSESVSVRMTPSGIGFEPAKLTLAKGTKVCFINEDPEARWPASNIHPTHEIFPEFDPKTVVRAGETWCFTFTKPGIWHYHDHLFPEFTGTINIE